MGLYRSTRPAEHHLQSPAIHSCPNSHHGQCTLSAAPGTEFLGVMARDIRSYDSEQDIRNAWKVCPMLPTIVKAPGLHCHTPGGAAPECVAFGQNADSNLIAAYDVFSKIGHPVHLCRVAMAEALARAKLQSSKCCF